MNNFFLSKMNLSDPSADNLNLANIEAEDGEAVKTDPEDVDQQGYLGSESSPELATEKDTFEQAQNVGLYQDADEDYPVPVGENNITD